ncbi:MAG: hypothetical protein EOP86_13985 [Verrucomicrobiaceae bacterium]|nr:MAG: hypothetical protein EOP86_13985 [Verrucomicrobiaceae bacterium]
MKRLIPLLPVFSALGLICCSTTAPRLSSPVDLRTAVRTLPEAALSGLSESGRAAYLQRLPGDFDEAGRRLHCYHDNPYVGVDSDSMFYLRLFEDAQGRTIAASHCARPRNGNPPSARNTMVFRMEKGRWRDISDEALPPGEARTWYFLFNDSAETVPCGPYTAGGRVNGGLVWYSFGKAAHLLQWEGGRFVLKPRP